MRTVCDKQTNTGLQFISGCIQPESFDQETIRGAPRAAATVVTGLGSGYGLLFRDWVERFSQANSISSGQLEICSILPQLDVLSGVAWRLFFPSFFRFVQYIQVHAYVRT